MGISRKTKSLNLLLTEFKDGIKAISTLDLIKRLGKKMNKTTVYRILDRLEDSGYLHSFLDKDGLKRYAKGDQGTASPNDSTVHPHFICQDCGISSCLPLEVKTPSIPNITISNSENLYIGKCNEC